MSVAHETLIARALGMEVLAIALVTNMSTIDFDTADDSDEPAQVCRQITASTGK